MKLVMFIGHFKTGSTSIQHFLASNWFKLIEQGVLYPSVENGALARNMRLLLNRADEDLHGQNLNVIEPHNALALKLKTEEDGHGVPPYYPKLPAAFQMFEAIEQQIAALQPHTTVLCSEVFALLGMTKDRQSVSRLNARLGQHDSTIYCSLRRPDDYLSSWHRQRLKFGVKQKPLRAGGMDDYLETAHFQQARMVRGWIDDGFQDAELVLRNFDDVLKNQGSVHDFMSETGIAIPRNAVMPDLRNPSVPSAFAEIGRLALIELPRQMGRNIVEWLISMRKLVPHASDRDVEVFGPAVRDKLVKNFEPVARELRSMSGGRDFYPDLSDLGRLRPISELEAANTALPRLVLASKISPLSPEEKDWLSKLRLPEE